MPLQRGNENFRRQRQKTLLEGGGHRDRPFHQGGDLGNQIVIPNRLGGQRIGGAADLRLDATTSLCGVGQHLCPQQRL